MQSSNVFPSVYPRRIFFDTDGLRGMPSPSFLLFFCARKIRRRECGAQFEFLCHVACETSNLTSVIILFDIIWAWLKLYKFKLYLFVHIGNQLDAH